MEVSKDTGLRFKEMSDVVTMFISLHIVHRTSDIVHYSILAPSISPPSVSTIIFSDKAVEIESPT
jgi:hypothetical protein